MAIKKLASPFQGVVHAKRCYREIKLLTHMNHENVRKLTLVQTVTASLSFSLCRWSVCTTYSHPQKSTAISMMCRSKCEFFVHQSALTFRRFSKKNFFSLSARYLVMELMTADLFKTLKSQKLTNDHVQFQVYQILRGLKACRHNTFHNFCLFCHFVYFSFFPPVRPFSRHHS